MESEIIEKDEMRIHNIPQDRAFNQRKNGDYETRGINFLKDRGGDLFIDVGARTGWYGFHALNEGIETIFIEPSKCVELIEKSLELNDFTAQIIQKCASDHTGAITLKNTRDEFFEHRGDGEPTPLPSTRLDNLISDRAHRDDINNIGLKIDVEGQEYEVLRGLEHTHSLIDYAIVEYHPNKCNTVEDAKELCREYGWRIVDEVNRNQTIALYSGQ